MLIAFVLLLWNNAQLLCSSFVPIVREPVLFDGRRLHLHDYFQTKQQLPRHVGYDSFPSYNHKSAVRRETNHRFFLRRSAAATTASVATSDPTTAAAAAAATQFPKKQFSYTALLKVIDESHNRDATESCTYLANEQLSSYCHGSISEEPTNIGCVLEKRYHSPSSPVLTEDSVNALRLTAQAYFETKDYGHNDTGAAIDRVELKNLLSSEERRRDPEWRTNLDSALLDEIYPLIRKKWLPNNDRIRTTSYLTVTSASIFAGGLFTGGKAALTTLERDAGMFMVHIDLGNEKYNPKDGENPVMGAVYFESLLKDNGLNFNESIVGPLIPGQMIIHKSSERTAAIVVPSNIRNIMENCEVSALDNTLRTQILRAFESSRHFVLRLVLTLNRHDNDAGADEEFLKSPPEAPSEERSYRLRSYAQFFPEGRSRYLTLAGLLNVGDYENHLWLGFDYIARVQSFDYQSDIHQRFSDINKAIFHLEKASLLCPTDPRVQFQLAMAIRAKIDLGQDFSVVKDEELYLKMAEALVCSAHLESAAVKIGVNGIQDLAICLNILAETWCKIGEFDKALDALDRWAECGSIRSALSIECRGAQSYENSLLYEWITCGNEIRNDSRHIALRTVGDDPVFEREDIALLRGAADKHFARTAGVQTSRYSMQYEGNSEVHLDDLCSGDAILKEKINRILQEKVYPLVRAAFSESQHSERNGNIPGSLCVYDSIFVRYNGDKAKAAGRNGASQPLHQDGGIYSVNMALNREKESLHDIGFAGGGTFFEALTVGDGDNVQHPIAPGHAIIHKTTQRHAGAPTTDGIRDILVIFLTVRRFPYASNEHNIWRVERAMRLQSIAMELDREKRILALQLACNNDPTNSEIPYWLGVHTIQGDMSDKSDERWNELCKGIKFLEDSISLNPADARAHFHLGMAISARHKYAMRTKRAHLLPSAKDAAESLINALEAAINLERKCDKAGCKTGINMPAAFLTLGEFMALLKNFDKAITYLMQIDECIENSGATDSEWADSIRQEASSLLDHCSREASMKSEAPFLDR